MANQFASGKRAIAICDRCGFRVRLTKLRELIVKNKKTNLMVCPECWEPDHPQLQLGMYPVQDPQALRNPRPDTTYRASGPLSSGSQGVGSRDIQWGWNPVGGAGALTQTPNDLAVRASIGTVTIVIS